VIPKVLAEHAREARSLIKDQGLVSYVRRWPVYVSWFLYQHQEFYIWRSDISCLSGSFVPRVEGYGFKAIARPEELDELLAEGLAVDSSFSLEEARWMLRGHVVGCLVLVHKELASWCWVGMSDDHTRYFVYPPPRKLDYASEAYAGRAYTLPRYRGLGLDTWGSLKRLEYLKEKGKSGFVLVTLKDNEPAIRVQKKFGSRMSGEMRLRKVLLREFWTEKWNDGR
jgi:GNAT superfamily N-acetyltransferase